jgi:alpha-glucosidase
MNFFKQRLLWLFLVANTFILQAQTYNLKSPNGDLQLTASVDKSISFEVSYKNKAIVSESVIDMKLKGENSFGTKPRVAKVSTSSTNQVITPVVAQKFSSIVDAYNELTIQFKNNFKITFRAYDSGIAYRFSTSLKKDIIIEEETFALNFSDETLAFFPKEDSFISHNERFYIQTKLDTLTDASFCSLPILNKVGNTNVLVTDADIYDYPGMFLKGAKGNSLHATFPKYVTKASPKPGGEDRDQVFEFADYLAKTNGKRDFPWRVLVITDKDTDLLKNTLVFQLSRPSKIKDTDWIKPGKVAWDWYNANNIYGVDFKSGVNTETYKYYIDFASKYGLEYIILDEGWTKSTTETRESNPDIDIAELVAYGKEKNVGIILWSLWGPLEKDLSILDLYKSWGVKGVKMDFMQRNDQYMVNFYEKVAEKAAQNHLLVDYHGAFKPTGLHRTYPNVISYEGVKGNENNKWSDEITPAHNVTLPFIRNVVGPMDFTPGSMLNARLENYNISFDRPMSLGTRSHQVAMYVVFESALQMLCETPSAYYKEAETTEFISKIPTVWDETIGLEGEVGEYIVMARRNGENWFAAGMTNWTPRKIEIDFSFLPAGEYQAQLMKDGINADKYAQDYSIEIFDVNATTSKNISLVSGGGFAIIITKK